MSWPLTQTVIWLVGAAAAGAITLLVTALLIQFLRGRAIELRHARECLAEYDRYYDMVMSDPATPDSVKEFLDEFDRGVMDRHAAHFIATSMFRQKSEWLRTPEEEPSVLIAMRDVCKHRPDLYEAFTTAIAKGFIATMLRWWAPARALHMIFIDLQNDPITPARALVRGFERRKDGPLPQAA